MTSTNEAEPTNVSCQDSLKSAPMHRAAVVSDGGSVASPRVARTF